MLIPATVVLSSAETTLEVMDMDRDEAALLYARCEIHGWDSREAPAGGSEAFDSAVSMLGGVMLFHPL